MRQKNLVMKKFSLFSSFSGSRKGLKNHLVLEGIQILSEKVEVSSAGASMLRELMYHDTRIVENTGGQKKKHRESFPPECSVLENTESQRQLVKYLSLKSFSPAMSYEAVLV